MSKSKGFPDRSNIEKKRELLLNLHEGDIVDGVVSSVPDFGIFVDLGGIVGLCTLTEMSWVRISHPSDIYKVDDRIRVKVLLVDPEAERVLLGIKQLSMNPWDLVLEKYPVGGCFKGKVVNVLKFGMFARLEEGVEGLIHLSEIKKVKDIDHPREFAAIGDEIEVVVLKVNTQKQEIDFGIKRCA